MSLSRLSLEQAKKLDLITDDLVNISREYQKAFGAAVEKKQKAEKEITAIAKAVNNNTANKNQQASLSAAKKEWDEAFQLINTASFKFMPAINKLKDILTAVENLEAEVKKSGINNDLAIENAKSIIISSRNEIVEILTLKKEKGASIALIVANAEEGLKQISQMFSRDVCSYGNGIQFTLNGNTKPPAQKPQHVAENARPRPPM